MAKVTLVFAVLLVALGLVGYVGTGSQHVTALIPTWFGLALALFGLLAMSPSESRRKLFMDTQCDDRPAGVHWRRGRGRAGIRAREVGGPRARSDCAGFEADHDRAVARLRNPVRAVVYCSAAGKEGLAHEHNAWRRHGCGRGAVAKRRQCACACSRVAKAQTGSQKALAGNQGAGGAAQRSAGRRVGAHGGQPRRRASASLYFESLARQSPLADQSAP